MMEPKIFEIKAGNNDIKIVVNYNAELVEKTVNADWEIIHTGKYEVHEAGEMKAYVNGKIYDRSDRVSKYSFRLIDNRNGTYSISGIRKIGFRAENKEGIARWETFAADVIAAGTPDDVAGFYREQADAKKKAEINHCEKIIAAAEKEIKDYGKLMTNDEIDRWIRNYNRAVNEGGDGYVPRHISAESYEEAKTKLAELL